MASPFNMGSKIQREPSALTPEQESLLSCLPSLRDGWVLEGPACSNSLCLSVIVLGASGDLAKKKTYPALFALHAKGFLSPRTQIVGYARTAMSAAELRERLRPHLTGLGDAAEVESFLALCTYMHGEYTGGAGYSALAEALGVWESDHPAGCTPFVGRLFYLALPPTVYPEVCSGLHAHVGPTVQGATPSSWVRIILEKPFGMDLASSEELASSIGSLWPENNLYRIDHYLGKELVQNMLVLRFANSLFSAWWNRHWISSVQVTFKEPFGTQGRGGYFDTYGIIRDVIQNHLIQVVALLAMEPPVSLHPDDIRDEKVKLLRCVVPAKAEECVLGQYVGAGGNPGYLEDPTVPPGSRTPTFAALRLHIRNERWAGVPFIIKAGKALNDRTALVRIQLKTPAASLFGTNLHHLRNELVIRFQPGEAIYAKMVVKKPGLEMDYVMSELDLTYPERFRDVAIPDAYERLILDCIRGDQQHFVRRDELRAAWAIFTPLLHAIDGGHGPQLHNYSYGSRGPQEADKLVADSGYTKTHQYEWASYDKRRSMDESRAAASPRAGPKPGGNEGLGGAASSDGGNGGGTPPVSTGAHGDGSDNGVAGEPSGPPSSSSSVSAGGAGPASSNPSTAQTMGRKGLVSHLHTPHSPTATGSGAAAHQSTAVWQNTQAKGAAAAAAALGVAAQRKPSGDGSGAKL